MKIFALLLSILAVAQGLTDVTTSKALYVRGGGSLGPLDADMSVKIGQTAVACYVGSSAAKIVAGQAGTEAPAVSVFIIFFCLTFLLLTLSKLQIYSHSYNHWIEFLNYFITAC